MICGGTMSGNCASGSLRMAMRPARTVTIAITIATIGRRIKKFEIIFPIPHSRSFKRDRIYHRVRSDFLCAFGDDSLTRFQSVFNNPHRPKAVADLDWPNTHSVITAHNGDPIAALQFGDGSLRNE